MTDEAELINRLKNGKQREQAFTELVRCHQERLYWQIRRKVVNHEDADDVLQNTLMKAWAALDTFRGESKLGTWLYQIALHETMNFLRKKKQMLSIDDEQAFMAQLSADPYFDGDETQQQLQQAIRMLPDKQRAVFNMKYFEEMKFEEISEVFGTSVGALKASYHFAVKKITAYFESLD